MSQRLKWVGLFVLGIGVAVAARSLISWRERVRVEAVVIDTLENNPGVAENERLMAAASERAWPVIAGQAPPAARESQRDIISEVADLEADSYWSALARTGWRMEEHVTGVAGFVATDMLRSRQLNPGDVYIRRADRDQLTLLLSAQIERVHHLMVTVDAVASQEFDFMLKRGSVHKLSYAEYESSLDEPTRARLNRSRESLRRKLLDSGADEAVVAAAVDASVSYDPTGVCRGAFRMATGDGSFSWVNLREMPQTKQAAELYVAGALDLCFQVLEFFNSQAGLSASDSEEILTAVEASLAKFRS